MSESRKIKRDWACSTYGRDQKSLQSVVRKPERKRPVQRLSHGWKMIIKLMFKIKDGTA
jgi:hypothetical protein